MTNELVPSTFQCLMGSDNGQGVHLSDDHLSVHSCVLGQSGSGKSKFLELLMRYLMTAKKGFCLIDPHGDLSEDLLAYAQARRVMKGDKAVIPRIHYLEPSYEQVFHYDPFKFRPSRPVAPEHLENAVTAWLAAKADRVGEIFLRKQGASDFQTMTRLQRNLTNVLKAVGTTIGKNGKHLPLSDALVLLDLEHPRHAELYSRVRPHLDQDVRSDFDRLHSYKRVEDRLKETESTINWMRSLLSPLVKSIFCEQVNTIDFQSIMQNGEILLVNLRETDYFSADQAQAIGGLFIHEILSTAQNTPREKRKDFYLFIDEAADFIGADIQRALGIMRKFRLRICLAAQDLSSFKKGDLDLRPKVLSQCGTIISFRQRWPEDTEILSRVMCSGNLDFEKYHQIVNREDGYEFIEMEDYSRNFSTSESVSTGSSISNTYTQSEGHSLSESDGRSWNSSDTTGRSSSEGKTSGAVYRADDGTLQSRSFSDSESTGYSSSHTHGSGHSRSDGESWSTGTGSSEGFSKSRSESEGHTKGESVTKKKVPLHMTHEEIEETPSLLNAVSDQFEKIRRAIHGLPNREALALFAGAEKAVRFRTNDVEEHWREEDKFSVIEKTKKQIFAQHSYFSAPQLSNAQQDARISEFVSEPRTPRGEPIPTAKSDHGFLE